MAHPQLRNQILETMSKEGKTSLWTKYDLIETLGIELRPAENALYNAWKAGALCRHKDKDKEGNFRYAIQIKDDKREKYVPTKGNSVPGGARKKKTDMVTSKALRKMFAQHMNSTAQLEDIVLGLADRLEELEKNHEKIKSLI